MLMRYTESQLQKLWAERDAILADPKNQTLVRRFSETKKLIQDLINMDVTIDRDKGETLINGKKLLIEGTSKGPSVGHDIYYAVAEDGLGVPAQANMVTNLVNAFPEYEKIIRDTAYLLGGNDYQSRAMRPEYKIVSNSGPTTYHDNNSLEVVRRNPSAHFSNNTYFFEVAQTLKDFQNKSFSPDTSRIVLHYPKEDYRPEEVTTERRILRTRFPYKFFFMWANPGEVIHMVSLGAYRNLIEQAPPLAYPDDVGMNQDIEAFMNADTGWPAYSKKIYELITGLGWEGANRVENLDKLSCLLSVLMLQDDSRQASRLLAGCKAIILQGPPGTGKTYMAKTLAAAFLGLSVKDEEFDEREFPPKKPEKAETPGNGLPGAWALVQFHPAYSYEDFIGGISPRLDNDSIAYTLKEGIFKRFCDYARQHPDGNFIFIIDEINRAHLSSIFGELMYALEYRGKGISLPHFTEKFSIPENVYIIGTMNTLDKSLTTFDIALRRRFGFFDLPPNLYALKEILDDKLEIANFDDYLARCENLNNQILNESEFLGLGENHLIGQAYFAKIANFLNREQTPATITANERRELWNYHLLPLLKEYLGGREQDEEIQRVLKTMAADFVGND